MDMLLGYLIHWIKYEYERGGYVLHIQFDKNDQLCRMSLLSQFMDQQAVSKELENNYHLLGNIKWVLFGGVGDNIVKSYAGTHDFIGGELPGFYDSLGNTSRRRSI